jgi:hypothetical protein
MFISTIVQDDEKVLSLTMTKIAHPHDSSEKKDI